MRVIRLFIADWVVWFLLGLRIVSFNLILKLLSSDWNSHKLLEFDATSLKSLHQKCDSEINPKGDKDAILMKSKIIEIKIIKNS